MLEFFISVLMILLVCTSAFVILIILMQRPSSNAGFGASLGGRAISSVFGGETQKVLTRATIHGVVIFFIASLLLSVLYGARHKRVDSQNSKLPSIGKTVVGK